MITARFIKGWAPKYDEETDDEKTYAELIERLRIELRNQRISFRTILRAVEWKTPRIKGKMDSLNPDKYCSFVRLAHGTYDKRTKLWLLTSLDGWGIPMASTMLHLLHPNRFPIVDYRVLEVLRDKNRLTANRDTEKGYWSYYAAIHRLMRSTGCCIREIDRALWAFHACKYRGA